MDFSIHIICRDCRATLEPIHADPTEGPLAIGSRVWRHLIKHATECRVLHPELPSALEEVWGKWPGDETEEEIQQALKESGSCRELR